MVSSFDNFENKKDKIITCPRCNQKVKSNSKICSSCGYIMNEDTSDNTEVLNFGMSSSTVTINQGIVSQEETKKIRIYKTIVNVLLLLVGLFGTISFLLPLFSNSNFWSNFETIANLYGIEIDNRLSFDSHTNIIGLLTNIGNYTFVTARELKPLYAMFWYEFIIVVLNVAIMFLSIFILQIAIRNLFFKANNIKYRTILEIVLVLDLFIVFGFNCFGIGPILLGIFCISSFIMFYVCGVVSKEKKFVLRHFIFKTITFVAMFALLLISNYGLVRLNVTLGANLYTNQDIKMIEGVEQVTFICRGLFYEFAAFIQSTSGDVRFTSKTFILNLLTLVFHLVYLVMIILSIGQLLKSLSKQSVVFPVKYSIISTVSFYAFAIIMIMLNQSVNDAFYSKYLETKTVFDLIDENTFSVLFLRGGMIGSIILNAPICAFSVIASKVCVKQVYR